VLILLFCGAVSAVSGVSGVSCVSGVCESGRGESPCDATQSNRDSRVNTALDQYPPRSTERLTTRSRQNAQTYDTLAGRRKCSRVSLSAALSLSTTASFVSGDTTRPAPPLSRGTRADCSRRVPSYLGGAGRARRRDSTALARGGIGYRPPRCARRTAGTGAGWAHQKDANSAFSKSRLL
jgi:hypothetical protein